MKVCIATGIYPPDIGGPATFAAILKKELPSRGHDVSVVIYSRISKKIPRGIRHLIYFFSVLRASRSADMILALDPVSAGLPAFFAARILRKKFFIRIVGDYAWEQGMQRFGITDLLDDFLGKKYGFCVELLRKIQCMVVGAAKKVIVPSLYLQEVIGKWGIPKEKITIVPNSVEPMLALSRDEAREKLGLSKTETVLLSVGRMVPWKGFEMLILMIDTIQKQCPCKLIIVGDGPQRGALEALRDRLKLHNIVIFRGAVSKEVLATHMVACDIFLLNTAYEGFSHQIIEAMATKMPVITTRAGGNAELVQDGVNALVVPYNNVRVWHEAVMSLVGDTKTAKRIAEEGYKKSAQYTRARTIDEFCAALEIS